MLFNTYLNMITDCYFFMLHRKFGMFHNVFVCSFKNRKVILMLCNKARFGMDTTVHCVVIPVNHVLNILRPITT